MRTILNRYAISGVVAAMVMILTSVTATAQLNVRVIARTNDVTQANIPDSQPLRWYQGETIDFALTPQIGTNAMALTNANLVAIWSVTSDPAPTNNSVYLWATGAITATATGQVVFSVAPGASAFPASNYLATATLYQTVTGTNQFVGVLHRAKAYVAYASQSPATVVPWAAGWPGVSGPTGATGATGPAGTNGADGINTTNQNWYAITNLPALVYETDATYTAAVAAAMAAYPASNPSGYVDRAAATAGMQVAGACLTNGAAMVAGSLAVIEYDKTKIVVSDNGGSNPDAWGIYEDNYNSNLWFYSSIPVALLDANLENGYYGIEIPGVWTGDGGVASGTVSVTWALVTNTFATADGLSFNGAGVYGVTGAVDEVARANNTLTSNAIPTTAAQVGAVSNTAVGIAAAGGLTNAAAFAIAAQGAVADAIVVRFNRTNEYPMQGFETYPGMDGFGSTNYPDGWALTNARLVSWTNDTNRNLTYAGSNSLWFNSLSTGDSWLQTPLLSNGMGLVSFYAAGSYAGSATDTINFEVSTDGTNWTTNSVMTAVILYRPNWALFSQSINLLTPVYLRIHRVACSINTAQTYIDDLTITKAPEVIGYVSTNDVRYLAAITNLTGEMIAAAGGLTNAPDMSSYLITNGDGSGLTGRLSESLIVPMTVNSGAQYGAYANGYDYGVGVGTFATGQTYGVGVGYKANGYDNGVAVGNQAYGATYGTALGKSANGYNQGVSVGNKSKGENYGVALGAYAIANGQGNIAIGGSSGTKAEVPAGWIDTAEIGRGKATLQNGLNYRGYGIVTSDGIIVAQNAPIAAATPWIASMSWAWTGRAPTTNAACAELPVATQCGDMRPWQMVYAGGTNSTQQSAIYAVAGGPITPVSIGGLSALRCGWWARYTGDYVTVRAYTVDTNAVWTTNLTVSAVNSQTWAVCAWPTNISYTNALTLECDIYVTEQTGTNALSALPTLEAVWR